MDEDDDDEEDTFGEEVVMTKSQASFGFTPSMRRGDAVGRHSSNLSRRLSALASNNVKQADSNNAKQAELDAYLQRGRARTSVFLDKMFLRWSVGLGDVLGEGSSGKVHAVMKEFALDDRDYAVKLVPCEDAEERAQRFEEARLHGLLGGHPSLVRYSFSWFDQGANTLHILMERCGKELWEYVTEDAMEAEGPGLDQETKMKWSVQLADGLSHVRRRRVIHRDLSPWNVFTKSDPQGLGSPPNLKIGDFGLSVRIDRSTTLPLKGMDSPDGKAMPLDESAMGSLFSAPELGLEYGFGADVYSLGVTLFFIWDAPRDADDLITRIEGIKEDATGRLPEDFDAPPALRELLTRMLLHDVEKRVDVNDALRELRRIEEELELVTRPRAVSESLGDVGEKLSPEQASCMEEELEQAIKHLQQQKEQQERALAKLKRARAENEVKG